MAATRSSGLGIQLALPPMVFALGWSCERYSLTSTPAVVVQYDTVFGSQHRPGHASWWEVRGFSNKHPYCEPLYPRQGGCYIGAAHPHLYICEQPSRKGDLCAPTGVSFPCGCSHISSAHSWPQQYGLPQTGSCIFSPVFQSIAAAVM